MDHPELDPLLEKTLDALVQSGVYISGVNAAATGRPLNAVVSRTFNGAASELLEKVMAATAAVTARDPAIVISFSRAQACDEAAFLADYIRAHTNSKVVANPRVKNDVTPLIPGAGAVLIILTDDYVSSPQCLAELYQAVTASLAKVRLCTLAGKPVDFKKLVRRVADEDALVAHEWDLLKTRFQIPEPHTSVLAALKSALAARPFPPEFKVAQDAETILRCLDVPCDLDPVLKGIAPSPLPSPPAAALAAAAASPSQHYGARPSSAPRVPVFTVGPVEFAPHVNAMKVLRAPDLAYLKPVQVLLDQDAMNAIGLFHAGLPAVLLKWLVTPQPAPSAANAAELHLAYLTVLGGLASMHVQAQALLRLRAHDACLVAVANFPTHAPVVCAALQLITTLATEALLLGEAPLSGPYVLLVKAVCKPWAFDLVVVQAGLALLAAMSSRASVGALERAGALTWILDLLKIYGAHKGFVEAALVAVRRMACTPALKRTMIQSGMGRALLECFSRHSKEPQVIQLACWAVDVLASLPENRPAMFDLGLGAMLISAMRGHSANKNICRCAASALRHMAANALVAGALFDLSAGNTLVDILTLHTSKIGAKLIPALAMWEYSVVADQPAAENFAELMRASDWALEEDWDFIPPATDLDITREVLDCLDCLCNKQALLQPLYSLGVGKAAVYAVRLYMSDHRVTASACRVLAKLALEKSNREALFMLGGAAVAVDILRMHRVANIDIVSLAGDLLLHLAGDLSRWRPQVDSDGMPWVAIVDEDAALEEGEEGDAELAIAVDVALEPLLTLQAASPLASPTAWAPAPAPASAPASDEI